MISIAQSRDVGKQKFPHRSMKEPCCGVAFVHGFDVIGSPTSEVVSELLRWAKHGLRSQFVDALFKVFG